MKSNQWLLFYVRLSLNFRCNIRLNTHFFDSMRTETKRQSRINTDYLTTISLFRFFAIFGVHSFDSHALPPNTIIPITYNKNTFQRLSLKFRYYSHATSPHFPILKKAESISVIDKNHESYSYLSHPK